MRTYYSDTFPLPLPTGHRFPIDKYQRLRERLEQTQTQGTIELIEAPSITLEQLGRVHTVEYLDQLRQGTLSPLAQRRIGFPWSEGMVRRCFHSAGGTLAAARAALEDGIAVHLAGGTHHAFPDSGQGFCVFNDVAVAVRTLIAEQRIERSVVIDCDVHQGNGTAAIFQKDQSTFTFSMHGANNFPFRKCAGDFDIALPDGTEDAGYLQTLQHALARQLPLAQADCVFYLAGADPFAGDRFGKLALTKSGLGHRDRLVIEACQAAKVPLTIVMAGGYATEIEDIVDIHARTVELAAQLPAD